MAQRGRGASKGARNSSPVSDIEGVEDLQTRGSSNAVNIIGGLLQIGGAVVKEVANEAGRELMKDALRHAAIATAKEIGKDILGEMGHQNLGEVLAKLPWEDLLVLLQQRKEGRSVMRVLKKIKDIYGIDISWDMIDLLRKSILPQIIHHESYLLQGMIYLMMNKEAWDYVSFRVKLVVISGLFILIALLMGVYPIQAIALNENVDQLGKFNIALSFFIAFFITWAESFVLIVGFLYPISMKSFHKELFLKVYVDNAWNEEMKAKAKSEIWCMRCNPVDNKFNFMFYLTIWLNFIPLLGTWLFWRINRKAYILDLFSQYFLLYGISSTSRQWKIIKENGLDIDFGPSTLFLKSLPFVGPVLDVSNTVGAALLCASEEPALAAEDNLQLNVANEP